MSSEALIQNRQIINTKEIFFWGGSSSCPDSMILEDERMAKPGREIVKWGKAESHLKVKRRRWIQLHYPLKSVFCSCINANIWKSLPGILEGKSFFSGPLWMRSFCGIEWIKMLQLESMQPGNDLFQCCS